MTETVLCYPEKDGKYLMLYRNKKENDINSQKWIGIGGHIEAGESEEEACLREIEEETGLSGGSVCKIGVVDFISDDYFERMHLFSGLGFEGELIDCDEGELCWVEKKKVPQLEIWEGDRVFLDLMADGKKDFTLTLRYENGVFRGYEIKWN